MALYTVIFLRFYGFINLLVIPASEKFQFFQKFAPISVKTCLYTSKPNQCEHSTFELQKSRLKTVIWYVKRKA